MNKITDLIIDITLLTEKLNKETKLNFTFFVNTANSNVHFGEDCFNIIPKKNV